MLATGWDAWDFVARLDAGEFDGRLPETLFDLSPAQLREVEWILLHSRPRPNRRSSVVKRSYQLKSVRPLSGGILMPTVDTTRTSNQSLCREERIRLRAEELYRRRGHRPGSAKEDWARAEREISEEEERAIDEASEESFPASDPPAH